LIQLLLSDNQVSLNRLSYYTVKKSQNNDIIKRTCSAKNHKTKYIQIKAKWDSLPAQEVLMTVFVCSGGNEWNLPK